MSKARNNDKSISAKRLSSGYRQDDVYDHCLIMIATGKWPAGTRMLSVRDAEKEWGVNRVAIQQAYKKLESKGLAVSRARSGYYVTGQENIHRISNFQVELENLHRTFVATISETTGLAPLPALRYLAKLAQVKDAEEPMCAFAECTIQQAEDLANEVAARLGISVTPLVVDEISGRPNRIPGHVRVLLTTHFHYPELKSLSRKDFLEAVAVPIEASPTLAGEGIDPGQRVIMIETEKQMAVAIADDASRALRDLPVESVVTDNIPETLTKTLSGDKSGETIVLLSPRDWGSVDQKWRDHPRVQVVKYRVRPEAWDLIADVVGMPLGALG